MVNRGWLYGLIVLLAQTCNPYYSANDSRSQYEEGIVFEDQEVEETEVEEMEVVEIPMDALELQEEVEVERSPPPPPAPEDEEVFVVVEVMPRFSGCEGKALAKAELKECSLGELMKFMSSNIEYPEIAKTNGIEGRVIVKFMVKKDGSVNKVRVLRDPGGGCGAEAERVVKMMPKWIPGKQRGRPVNVWFTLLGFI